MTPPNPLWETDSTYGYVAGEHRLFSLQAIIDVCDRHIVAYHIGLSCRAAESVAHRRSQWGPEAPVIRIDNGRVSRDAVVFPYRYYDDSAMEFAQSIGALLAGKRGQVPSLSPSSLLALAPPSRLVLPSPNGLTCTVIARESQVPVLAGCLRNARLSQSLSTVDARGPAVQPITCKIVVPRTEQSTMGVEDRQSASGHPSEALQFLVINPDLVPITGPFEEVPHRGPVGFRAVAYRY